jgi:hypothetical protein
VLIDAQGTVPIVQVDSQLEAAVQAHTAGKPSESQPGTPVIAGTVPTAGGEEHSGREGQQAGGPE